MYKILFQSYPYPFKYLKHTNKTNTFSYTNKCVLCQFNLKEGKSFCPCHDPQVRSKRDIFGHFLPVLNYKSCEDMIVRQLIVFPSVRPSFLNVFYVQGHLFRRIFCPAVRFFRCILASLREGMSLRPSVLPSVLPIETHFNIHDHHSRCIFFLTIGLVLRR